MPGETRPRPARQLAGSQELRTVGGHAAAGALMGVCAARLSGGDVKHGTAVGAVLAPVGMKLLAQFSRPGSMASGLRESFLIAAGVSAAATAASGGSLVKGTLVGTAVAYPAVIVVTMLMSRLGLYQ